MASEGVEEGMDQAEAMGALVVVSEDKEVVAMEAVDGAVAGEVVGVGGEVVDGEVVADMVEEVAAGVVDGEGIVAVVEAVVVMEAQVVVEAVVGVGVGVVVVVDQEAVAMRAEDLAVEAMALAVVKVTCFHLFFYRLVLVMVNSNNSVSQLGFMNSSQMFDTW